MSVQFSEDSMLKIIGKYLSELGWEHETVSKNILRAHYQGQFGDVKVMIHVHAKGIMMAVNPILSQPDLGWGPSVLKLIDILNREVRLVRIGMDREGDVFVKVELPPRNIELEHFIYVLLNLCQVSEQLMVPVLQANAYDKYEPQGGPEQKPEE